MANGANDPTSVTMAKNHENKLNKYYISINYQSVKRWYLIININAKQTSVFVKI